MLEVLRYEYCTDIQEHTAYFVGAGYPTCVTHIKLTEASQRGRCTGTIVLLSELFAWADD